MKVVSVADAGRPAQMKSAKGYVTQAKHLKGLNATQIETGLGLRPLSLKCGAYVFYFARLPEMHEVEQRFTADMPDGKIWDDQMHTAYLAARDKRDASGSDVIDYYPPGFSRHPAVGHQPSDPALRALDADHAVDTVRGVAYRLSVCSSTRW